MGRADDKEGDGLPSEADEEEDKDTSDVEDPDYESRKQDKDTSDIEYPDYDSRKKYKCTKPGCTARFLRPSRLTWHLRKHNDERPYKCDREGCDRAYTNSSHLKRHQNSHTPVTKSYECTECSVIVGSLFSLKRHHRKIHDPTRLTCELCGAKFRKKHCYTEHLSMHAGVTLYDCDGCDQQFSTQRLLKKHQIIHEKLKSYACKQPGCTEIFNQWSKLVKHVEIKHEFGVKEKGCDKVEGFIEGWFLDCLWGGPATDSKNDPCSATHECSKCDKKFKNKAQLSLHEAVHANKSNPTQCPYENCPRFYTHNKNLEEHIATTHLGRRFICDACGQELTSKASIIRHINKIHEEPKKSVQRKKRQFRRKRKDAGKRKRSMAAKLAGLKLPHELEKIVLMREPRVILERAAQSRKASGKDNEKKSSPSLAMNDTETFVKNYLEELSDSPKQTEEEISLSASSLLDTGRLLIYENPAEESSDTNEQTNKKILPLRDEQMQNDSGIIGEKVLEKSSVESRQITEEIELLEVEREQTNGSNVLESNLQESSELPEKIDKGISPLAEEIMQDDMEIMLEESSFVSGRIDKGMELLEVEQEQTNGSNVLESNLQESSELSEKIDRGISLLAEKIMQDDTEIMLEESSVVSGRIDREIELLEIELEQTNELNVLENNLQESPESPGEIDRGLSFPTEEIVQNDTEMILGKFLEKSPFSLLEAEKGVSILVVHRVKTGRDPRRKNVWTSKVAEKRVEEYSNESERMDVDVSSVADNLLENDPSGKTSEEISVLKVNQMQTDGFNGFNSHLQTRSDPSPKIIWDLKLVENHVKKCSNVPEQIEADKAERLFANNLPVKDAGIVLEKFSDATKEREDEVSFLTADLPETERSKVFENYLPSPD